MEGGTALMDLLEGKTSLTVTEEGESMLMVEGASASEELVKAFARIGESMGITTSPSSQRCSCEWVTPGGRGGIEVGDAVCVLWVMLLSIINKISTIYFSFDFLNSH